jgi:hypothetical protein
MIIYKNIGRDNIRKKRKENKYFWRCVLVLRRLNFHHFFFDCDKYTDNREILFDSLNWLPSNINIDVKLLTKGSDFL